MQHVAPDSATRCNTVGRVTPAKAATLLRKNRSSIKRYLDEYPELLGADGLVDFEAVQRHRADNPRIADQVHGETAEPKPSKASVAPAGGRRDSKHRLEEIKAWEAEREWALSIGQLVDPSKMLDGATVAAMALRDKLMAPDFVLCERLAEERDPRVIQSLLRETNRGLVEEFIAALRKIVAPADAAA